MRHLLALLLLLAPALARAQPNAAQVLAALAPAEAAGLQRGRILDLEDRPGGAGLGAAAEYRPAEGAGVATLYRYTRGQAAPPEGADSPAVQQEIQAALAEINALQGLRRYLVTGMHEMPSVTGPDGAPALRCLALRLGYETARPAESYLCAGVLRGAFVKLRATWPEAPAGEGEQRMLAFGRAVVAGLLR